jgi:hypothetical protein
MRLTLKAINHELAKQGYTARLAKGAGYFYFQFGDAVDWWDRTIGVATLNALTLEHWVSELLPGSVTSLNILNHERVNHANFTRAGTFNFSLPFRLNAY